MASWITVAANGARRESSRRAMGFPRSSSSPPPNMLAKMAI
jgi:hypothetical protein